MSVHTLLDELNSKYPMSVAFRHALEKELVPMELPRFHLLLDAPNISGHIYFLQSGLAMTFMYPDGQKTTTAFWKAGQVIVSFESFFNQKPSFEFIRLMSKCSVICLSFRSMETLLAQHPEARSLLRVGIIQGYKSLVNRLNSIQQYDSATRFGKLLDEYMGIEQMVPQDAIASYLGITPQSLSRLKRKKGARSGKG